MNFCEKFFRPYKLSLAKKCSVKRHEFFVPIPIHTLYLARRSYAPRSYKSHKCVDALFAAKFLYVFFSMRYIQLYIFCHRRHRMCMWCEDGVAANSPLEIRQKSARRFARRIQETFDALTAQRIEKAAQRHTRLKGYEG